MRPGRYIVLEGIDGAGTTTLQQGLAEALRQLGIDVSCAAQPSNDGAGAMARKFLKQRLEQEFERAALALFFAADRLELRRKFAASIAAGQWVLCDRSVLSSLVYQGSELDEEWVASINRYSLPADLTFLLDLPAETSWARIGARGGELERFEAPETLGMLRQRYLDAASGFASPVRLLDATQSPAAVLAAAVRALSDQGWLN